MNGDEMPIGELKWEFYSKYYGWQIFSLHEDGEPMGIWKAVKGYKTMRYRSMRNLKILIKKYETTGSTEGFQC